MARVTSVRGAPPSGRAGPRPPSWRAVLSAAGGAAALVLALYLAHPLIQGYRLPVGPDGPVYTWWTRYAEVAPLGGVASGRPGVPAAALVLGAILATRPVETIALLGPVLAAVGGLAGAAVLDAALGPRLPRTVLAAVLTGAFAAYLAGGWLANLAQAGLFLGAVACFGVAVRSWRAVWAGAGFLAAAGLAHRLFLLVALAILAGVILAHVGQALRATGRGVRAWDTAAGRIAAGAGAGAVGGALGLTAVSGVRAVPGDTSQDGFFQRLGLDPLLANRYRERLAGDLTRAAAPLAVGVGLGAFGLRILRRSGPPEGVRYVTAVLGSWATITVVGVLALMVTRWGPPNRMVVFGFFLPLGAALGLEALRRRGTAAVVVAVVAAAAFAAVAMFGWYRQSPSVSEGELLVAREAGRVVDRLPEATPVVFLVDTPEPASAFHVTRFSNVIRMGVPALRLPDSHVVVGSPQDYLARRPTLTGDPEHDAIAQDSLLQAEPVRDRAVVLLLWSFNPAFASNPEDPVAPGVKVLAGPRPPPLPEGPPSPGPVASAPELALLSVTLLVLLALLGGGWATWGLPGAGRAAVVALSPAAGLGVAVLGGVAADLVGWGPGPPAGVAAAAVLAAAGYAAAVVAGAKARSARD
ncbi:MAG: hypothetical protein ACRDI0_12535 [Actinomycetota bacterium]